MIQSRYLIPQYIAENSHDIHVFLRLIDLVANNSKSKSDDFINILNPDKCPDSLLPILASYYGYKYDYNETYDKNRTILKSYRNMIRYKGSAIGVNLAVATSIVMLIDKSIIDAQDLFDVAYYDKYYYCINCNYTSYTHFDECPNCGALGSALENKDGAIIVVIDYPIYSSKVYDLVETVRPAGTGCTVHHGTLVEQVENLGISDFIAIQSKYLNAGMSEVGGKDALVGFSSILKESPLEMKYCESCGNLFKLVYFETTDTVKQNDKTYYVYNALTDEYEVFTGNSFEEGVKYYEVSSECPYCGSSDFKDSNNSNLRLLYRLYNNDREFNGIVRNIINNIEIGDTVNDSNIVGVILNFHINNESGYALTSDKTYYLEVYYNHNGTTYDTNTYVLTDSVPTTDTTVVADKAYFTFVEKVGDDYILDFKLVEEPTGNPSEQGYFEKTEDQYIQWVTFKNQMHLEYEEADWQELLHRDCIYSMQQYNRNKTYWIKNGDSYTQFTGNEFQPGVDYYEETNEWDIKNFLQSFIFGLKPYIKIIDFTETADTSVVADKVYYELDEESGIYSVATVDVSDNPSELGLYERASNDIECFKYNIIEILDNIVDVNKTALSTMLNHTKQNISYNFVKTDDGRYAVRANDEAYRVKNTDTYMINYHDYLLNKIEITQLDYDNIIDGIPEKDVTEFLGNEIYTDNTTFNFKLGASDDFPRRIVDNPTTEEIDNDIVSNILMKEENTSDVTVNPGGYYINVCNSCGEVIIRKGNGSVNICPKCGGIETIKVTTSSGGEDITQITDPTILVGSYMIDLYFE